MDIHEKKRRAVTVVSCLESTWTILQGSTASITDRYQHALPLKTLRLRETAEALIAARLAPAYKKFNFRPPYPAWPFPPAVFEDAIDLQPRLLLKRCEDFRRLCVAQGRVSECPSLRVEGERAAPATPRADTIEVAFEREGAAANIAPMLTAEGEEELRSLLDTTLQLLVKHFDLPDSIDAEAQRDPRQSAPGQAGRR